MQMKGLNKKRHNAAGAESAETVDLDEKIRRIREDNKKREQRFQEIEEDKKMASKKEKSFDKKYRDNKTQPSKNFTMKGVVQSANIKKAKGRGQRLVEMSNNPLKAERFKSMVEGKMDICEEHLNLPTFKLKNNCRSDIRKKIKSRSTVCSDRESVVKHVEIQESDISRKLVCIPENQQNEIRSEETESVQLSEDVCQTSQEDNETDETADNVEQETATEMKKCNILNKQQDEDPSVTPQKKDKPKIKVTLKKTASSSSFDESMAMLSPLDVPSNWGDVDFSDEELPPVSVPWKNS